MSKSKSDLLLALSLALLGGCDALRAPVPDSPASPLRASFAGLLVEGAPPTIHLGRPVDDLSQTEYRFPWIDLGASRLVAEQALPSGSIDPSLAAFSILPGLKGVVLLWDLRLSTRVDRVRGSLRWNASAPYRVSEGGMVTDSFDLRPQAGARVGFRRDGVRGDLCLRWPKLASVRYDSLRKWAGVPDSVVAFRNDWIALSRRRGDTAARILLEDTYAYRYFDPETSILRRVLDGASAQKVFLVGDSIWFPRDRWASLFVDAEVDAFRRVFVDLNAWGPSNASGFAMPSAANGTTLELARPRDPMEFRLRDLYHDNQSTRPIRVMVQIAGTCPAFDDWRGYGPTDRWHRPTGNVAPFDGYLCEIFPDTLSFPRGDIILTPPDTSTQPKVVYKVDSAKSLPQIWTP